MKKGRTLILGAVAFFCAVSLQAQVPITVTNGDFTLPGVKTNFDNAGSVPGWSTDGPITDSGVEAAGSAFWKGVDGSAYNLTDYIIGTGDEFTLTFDGFDIYSGANNFVASLYYDNGDGVRNVLASTTFNGLGTSPESLQVFATATPEAIGSYIGIEFDAKNNGWTGVDNVTLTKTDTCGSVELTSAVKVNDGDTLDLNCAYAIVGNTVELIPNSLDSAQTNDWHWEGPNGFSADVKNLKLVDVETNQSGTYYATYFNSCGNVFTQLFHLTVSAQENGARYFWPEYNPTIAFTPENPNLPMPTQNLPDQCGGTDYNYNWWTFKKGPNANSLVTDEAIDSMLKYFDREFAYFSDEMGWPRDKRARNGYRSAIYLFGSGLCTDDADSTALGGWMGVSTYNGEAWPNVLASYFPVSRFDPNIPDDGSMGAMIHEGIHAILADMPGCKDAAWFHEGGNTWLQQEAASRRSGGYGAMGFLNAGTFVAPFMPIECYSGWLQDGSFGGPAAEGVYQGDYASTWRTLLGGTQYGNGFPVYLAQALGDKSIPWIWQNCPSRVLEGIADSIGEEQIRRVIYEYRAKQALVDFGPWTNSIRDLINGYSGINIIAEYEPAWLHPEPWTSTPYVKVTKDTAGWYVPEARTTPGWSGGNQIPFHVSGDTVVMYFQPLDVNMTCQLCYRTSDGQMIYGQPVFGGECMIALDQQPANGVVFAVVSNTDYIYKGEKTRTHHYDYRIKPVKNVLYKANIYKKWFNYNTIINDPMPVEIDTTLVLLHSYPFEDGTAKDTVGIADGTLVGGTISDGIYTTSAQGEYVDLPGDLIGINNYSAVTVEAFVKAGTTNTANTMISYFGGTSGTFGVNYFYITLANNNASSAAISCENTTSPWAAEDRVYGTKHDDGGLYHLVSTLSGDEITWYVNGTLVGKKPFTGSNRIQALDNSFAYLCKGGYSADATWIGSIDEFNIYQGIMDENTIAARAANFLVATDIRIVKSSTQPEMIITPTVLTNGAFHLRNATNANVRVFNVTGQLVTEFEADSDVTEFYLNKSQMYLIEVRLDGKTRLFKVIKV
ncbi:LamG-like jellyroll fold domain-containing protein [Saccharicrinis sp. FJH2]|uniref:LamG-like jellyroll fold domain-containing protein n=1 Tax=Saccharicrinis sp. FJH65 TaxID=3344659 RepID=UPI0035F3786E